MNLTGQIVIHKKYGIGKIEKIIDNHIHVKFQEINDPKTFLSPSCFKNGFLKLQNEDLLVKQSEEDHRKHDNNKRKQQIKNIRSNWNASTKTMDGFYAKYKKALQEEISYLQKNGGKKQPLFDGKLIEYKKGKYIYSFESDTELSYPEGTPITVWYRNTNAQGNIVGCEDFTIIFETDAKLGKDIPSIDISAEPWRLLNALIERLEIINDRPSKIVKSLICDGKNRIDHSDTEIRKGQQTALKMSFDQPITFIWGPPGTGKTQTLANIALKHIENGGRVLMLSYSNVSVDGAIIRVANLAKDRMKPGIFVRYGYPKEKEVLEHEYLTSYNLAIHQYPDLFYKRQQLLERRKYIPRTSPEYIRIEEDLKNIRHQLISEEKECVKQARFVATTVSKAVIDPTIYESEFDVVIFDEASMAYVPQIIFSASLAKKHFVCMGDFRQLPPIVQNSQDSVLNTDIFQYCGIVKAVDQYKQHPWLCMLDTQYRMHPKIADFVSKTMYQGLLKTTTNEENIESTGQNPAKNQPIVFVDLSKLPTTCIKGNDNSRINILSAFLLFYMALQINKKYKVGIITPYHAQARLFNAMIKDMISIYPETGNILSSTVHQFQGSEKDVILYDAVDGDPMKAPGMLLTSMHNDYANRLFNVALTRAKGKFISLVNIDYLKDKNISKDLMFQKMINEQKQKSRSIADKYFKNLKTETKMLRRSLLKFYKAEEGYKELRNDISKLKKEMKIFICAEHRKYLPKEWKSFVVETPFAGKPIVIIDKKLVWYGLPVAETESTPIIRFEGSNTASAIKGFMEINHVTDESNKSETANNLSKKITEDDAFTTYVKSHKKCPDCGKPMRLVKSKKGNFFLSCTGYPQCKTTEFVDVWLVEEYLNRNGGTGQKCEKCKYSLMAERGRYGGVAVHCCGSPQHEYELDQI